ncbi:MAG: hypothetical protein AAGD38_02000 [Acidobacteriota bacterium]
MREQAILHATSRRFAHVHADRQVFGIISFRDLMKQVLAERVSEAA